MTERNHEFIWLDLETTGLDPDTEIVLEFGVILAADDRAGDMSIVNEFQSVITPYDYGPAADHEGLSHRCAAGILADMHPRVREMHTKNGLIAELEKPELCCSIQEADAFLAELAGDGLPSLAGNSVHFDLGFILKHMPNFAKRLSHRVFDVSTLIRAERTYGDSVDQITTKADAHRALDDCRASLATARAFRARRFWSCASV
jgi:oligoribonuclease